MNSAIEETAARVVLGALMKVAAPQGDPGQDTGVRRRTDLSTAEPYLQNKAERAKLHGQLAHENQLGTLPRRAVQVASQPLASMNRLAIGLGQGYNFLDHGRQAAGQAATNGWNRMFGNSRLRAPEFPKYSPAIGGLQEHKTRMARDSADMARDWNPERQVQIPSSEEKRYQIYR